MHIAFLELIIDPACSVVFEAETEEPGIMERPPRPADEPLFGRSAFSRSACCRVPRCSPRCSPSTTGRSATGHRETDVRALTFATLVIGNLGLILVNRSWTQTVIAGVVRSRNTALGWVVGGALGFLTLLLTVPFLRDLFRFAPMHAVDIGVVVLAAAAGVVWFEVYKMISRKRQKRPRRAARLQEATGKVRARHSFSDGEAPVGHKSTVAVPPRRHPSRGGTMFRRALFSLVGALAALSIGAAGAYFTAQVQVPTA